MQIFLVFSNNVILIDVVELAKEVKPKDVTFPELLFCDLHLIIFVMLKKLVMIILLSKSNSFYLLLRLLVVPVVSSSTLGTL